MASSCARPLSTFTFVTCSVKLYHPVQISALTASEVRKRYDLCTEKYDQKLEDYLFNLQASEQMYSVQCQHLGFIFVICSGYFIILAYIVSSFSRWRKRNGRIHMFHSGSRIGVWPMVLSNSKELCNSENG
jgi:hypothetical protein